MASLTTWHGFITRLLAEIVGGFSFHLGEIKFLVFLVGEENDRKS